MMSRTPAMSHHPLRTASLCLLAAIILIAVGCQADPTATARPTHTQAPPPTETPLPTPTPTPEPLVFFPADEGPHDTPIEWWYFNGMLHDDTGKEYSYHFVTFRSAGPPGVTPHLLQATLSVHEHGAHYTAETGLLAPERSEGSGVDVKTGQWLMTGDAEGYDLSFGFTGVGEPVSVELRAAPQRKPVLHGGSGLVDLGKQAGSTYYYSRTRLDVAGWIRDGDQRRPVRGPGWMDHQWGEVTSARIGWDWAGIQLDDGSDLMVAVLFYPNGLRPAAAHGTYIMPSGEVTYIHPSDLSLTSTGSWTSPKTDIEYPMGWMVEIDRPRMKLELTPYVEHAEFTSNILEASYWEGAVAVTGERLGEPVTGWGFVELVGYDPRQLAVTPPAPAPRQ